jgi:hypothetical protein
MGSLQCSAVQSILNELSVLVPACTRKNIVYLESVGTGIRVIYVHVITAPEGCDELKM